MEGTMKTFIFFFVAAWFCLGQDAPAATQNSCAACHDTLDATNSAIVKGYRTGIHAEKGITCAGCHGGDPTKADMDAMDPDKGFVGVPARKDIPHFCGKCHSDYNYMRHYNPAMPVDQEEIYGDSRHGKLLANGDTKVAVCISCHGVHGILPPSDTHSPVYHLNVPATCAKCHSDSAYMAPYGIPTNQYERYKESVHGVAALQKQMKGAPVCNDCHGNHGAAPPGVSDVSAVCAVCHTFNGELFDKSPHKAAFDAAGISECAACHTAHDVKTPTDAMLGMGKGAVCTDCHSVNDPGGKQAAMMKHILDSLINGQETSEVLLKQAQALNMDVSDGEVVLDSVRQTLIESRTAVHAFNAQHMLDVTRKGFAEEKVADSVAISAVHEHKFRREGFGFATLIITGLALLLYLKIRQIESKQRTGRTKEQTR
jgi:predicted CXXCH cytochrome family protein